MRRRGASDRDMLCRAQGGNAAAQVSTPVRCDIPADLPVSAAELDAIEAFLGAGIRAFLEVAILTDSEAPQSFARKGQSVHSEGIDHEILAAEPA